MRPACLAGRFWFRRGRAAEEVPGCNPALISKVQKAHQYASEPERVHVESLRVRFDGDNSSHVITYADGSWTCDCEFFQGWRTCSHTMALPKLMSDMVEAPAARGFATV